MSLFTPKSSSAHEAEYLSARSPLPLVASASKVRSPHTLGAPSSKSYPSTESRTFGGTLNVSPAVHVQMRMASVVSNHSAGSTGGLESTLATQPSNGFSGCWFAVLRISKCRCGPPLLPEFPLHPNVSPARNSSPSERGGRASKPKLRPV